MISSIKKFLLFLEIDSAVIFGALGSLRAFIFGSLTCPYYNGRLQKYEAGLCPIAESIQPRLLQFKTNYLQSTKAMRAAEALAKAIRHFQ